MSDFFRFPHTPHLVWLDDGQPRGDKILSSEAAAELLSGDVVVEEKVDGANIGISVTPEHALQVQSRGAVLTPELSHPQFRSLWTWIRPRQTSLTEALSPGLILFGEWCVAVHSVEYDRLPDWFLGFDVYDRVAGGFWDSERRNALLTAVGLCAVPELATGRFTVAELTAMLDRSRVGSTLMEGLVVRKEHAGMTVMRAKLVRPSFVQQIETHWSRGPLRRQTLLHERRA